MITWRGILKKIGFFQHFYIQRLELGLFIGVSSRLGRLITGAPVAEFSAAGTPAVKPPADLAAASEYGLTCPRTSVCRAPTGASDAGAVQI